MRLTKKFKRQLFSALFLVGAALFSSLDACAPSQPVTSLGIQAEDLGDPIQPLPPPPPQDIGDIRVATWNIRWFPSGFPNPNKPDTERANIRKAAAAIRALEPAILCAQEIRNADIATQLAEAVRIPNFQLASCSAFTNYDGSAGLQQTAIFSIFPVIKASWDTWHSADFVYPPRGYTFALLDAPGGPIGVFSIHLKSNYVPEEESNPRKASWLNRLKRELASDQVRALATQWLHNGTVPKSTRFIIAGDFNTAEEKRWKGERTLANFRSEGWTSCYQGIPPDQCYTLAAEPQFGYDAVTFDYIFSRGFSDQHSLHIHPIQGDLSDHAIVSILLR